MTSNVLGRVARLNGTASAVSAAAAATGAGIGRRLLSSIVCEGTVPHGLELYPDFFTPQEEKDMLSELTRNRWSSERDDADVKRKMANLLGRTLKTLPVTHRVIQRAVDQGCLREFPDGSQLNKYPSNGCIPFHVDARGIGASICMFSFQSSSLLDMIPTTDLTDEHNAMSAEEVLALGGCRLLLEPRSLLVLRHDARYHWAHRVPSAPTFTINNRTYTRAERFSLVFWSTKLDPNAPPIKRHPDATSRIRLT
ncbi:hypothetical protein PTSG_06819 [Salpingoeca rosetta]|uniref:Fe2OG dioxygenase domain-containing protein n=1 Tax=Salpingoeca rosetta (strain ATCC 50818 / BSB-021) TaxID=946362 RepID=F2UEW6_SALR5|nr:uncharacterized protein PTSG_06819 [Salpingoeca rosetta]EGD75166.1 hypothetical protein PTSG_06819 [Salpingoeca rosetta]|eukprot:XP_004992219.1 hypothetical protein PTSG_06819 [Salpingoeca rosetta]